MNTLWKYIFDGESIGINLILQMFIHTSYWFLFQQDWAQRQNNQGVELSKGRHHLASLGVTKWNVAPRLELIPVFSWKMERNEVVPQKRIFPLDSKRTHFSKSVESPHSCMLKPLTLTQLLYSLITWFCYTQPTHAHIFYSQNLLYSTLQPNTRTEPTHSIF
jgi:hypothetical protein